MIVVENVVLTDDIRDKHFVCDLKACKGACCVEGELGAPLEEEECLQLENVLEEVSPFLSEEARDVIEKQGPYVLDEDGDFSTSTINGKECVFAIYDDQGILKCGIEKAYQEKKINFQKPISCHLYPLRIGTKDQYHLGNYHQWEICDPACKLGDQLKIPLYIFLKEALIRKFGNAWYDHLVHTIEQNQENIPTE
jgi:hypothetical protein